MNHNSKKIGLICAAAALSLTLFASCGLKSGSANPVSKASGSSSQSTPAVSKAAVSQSASSHTDGGWYYYMNNKDGADAGKLFREKQGGRDAMKVTDAKVNGNFAVDRDIVYYSDFNNGGIYKIKGDGTGRAKISDCAGWPVAAYGGYLYLSYSADSDKSPSDGCAFIYRMRPDGTGLKKLCGDPVMSFTINDGGIYYNNYSDSYRLYRINADGSGKKRITQDTDVMSFTVGGGRVFYIKQAQNESSGLIRSIGTDGTGDTAVGSCKASQIAFSDGALYCSATNGSSFKINPDGTGKTEIPASSWELVRAFKSK